MDLLLAATCLVVGFLCGCTSVGGILLIPVIQYCADLSLARLGRRSGWRRVQTFPQS